MKTTDAFKDLSEAANRASISIEDFSKSVRQVQEKQKKKGLIKRICNFFNRRSTHDPHMDT